MRRLFCGVALLALVAGGAGCYLLMPSPGGLSGRWVYTYEQDLLEGRTLCYTLAYRMLGGRLVRSVVYDLRDPATGDRVCLAAADQGYFDVDASADPKRIDVTDIEALEYPEEAELAAAADLMGLSVDMMTQALDAALYASLQSMGIYDVAGDVLRVRWSADGYPPTLEHGAVFACVRKRYP